MKEDNHTEWKESWRDEWFRTVAAFANSDGGVIEVGRNDRGIVIGVDDIEKLLVNLPNKGEQKLGIIVDVQRRDDTDGEYLRVSVEPHPFPVSYNGKYYVRSGSTTQELKGTSLNRFLLAKQGLTWDQVPDPRIQLSKLSSVAVEDFRQRASRSKRLSDVQLDVDNASLIEKLDLLENDYLKRAAGLLFYPRPESLYLGAAIKIGFFRSGADLVYHDIIDGHLFEQSSRALELLRTKYLRGAISYEGLQRVETMPVPEEALREAVVNAIVHRDYSTPAPIQIRLYPDRLVIRNPGELPEGWTVEQLRQSPPSRPFNPAVAKVFFYAGDIESWGRGFELIFSECREAGVPEPLIEYSTGDFSLTFRFSDEYVKRVENSSKTENKETESDRFDENWGRNWGRTWGRNWGTTATNRRIAIARAMAKDPAITIPTIAEEIGLSVSAIEYHLKAMREAGAIRHIGPTKSGHWEVRE